MPDVRTLTDPVLRVSDIDLPFSAASGGRFRLLKEDGFLLLKEDGGALIVEDSNILTQVLVTLRDPIMRTPANA